MKLILKYEKYFKKAQKRKLEEKIRFMSKFILSALFYEDTKIVVQIMVFLYKITELIVVLLNFVIPFAISKYITNNIFVHISIYLILSIIRYDNKYITEIKKNVFCLFRHLKTDFYKKLYKYFIIKFIFFRIMLKVFVPLSAGYILNLIINNNTWFLEFFIFSITGTIFMYSIFFYITKKKISLNNKSSYSLLKSIITFKENKSIKIVNYKTDFHLILKRYLDLNNTAIKTHIIIIILSIIFIVYFKFYVTSYIILLNTVVVFISLNPLITYLLLSLLVFTNFLEKNYTEVSFYVVKKYNLFKSFVITLFLKTIFILKFYIILFIIPAFISIFFFKDIMIIFLLLINLIHTLNLIFIMSVRVNRIYLLKFDDTNIEEKNFSFFNILEDYILLGGVFLALGPILIYLNKTGNIRTITFSYMVFTIITTIYSITRFIILSNKKRGEK